MAKAATKLPTVIPVNPAIFAVVQNIIAEIAGYEPNDIVSTFNFEEDLGLDMERNFPLIIKRVNRHFDIDLIASHLTADEVDTVADLVSLIEDETELG